MINILWEIFLITYPLAIGFILINIFYLFFFGIPNKRISEKLVNDMYAHDSYYQSKGAIVCCSCLPIMFIRKQVNLFFSHYICYRNKDKKVKKINVFRFTKLSKELKLIYSVAPSVEERESKIKKELWRNVENMIKRNLKDKGEDTH